MRLHPAIRMLPPQRACRLELRGRRRRCEARRDRVAQAPATVPAPDQRLRLVVAASRAVAQVLRRMAVHQHLARHRTHAAPRGFGEECLHRSRVHGAEHRGRGRAGGERQVEEPARDRTRVPRLRERALGREGVARQPVEQLGAVARDHRELRVVHVAVDEARREHRAARQALDRRAFGQAPEHLPRRTGVGDLPVRDHDHAVGLVTACRSDAVDERVAAAGEERPAQCERRRVAGAVGHRGGRRLSRRYAAALCRVRAAARPWARSARDHCRTRCRPCFLRLFPRLSPDGDNQPFHAVPSTGSQPKALIARKVRAIPCGIMRGLCKPGRSRQRRRTALSTEKSQHEQAACPARRRRLRHLDRRHRPDPGRRPGQARRCRRCPAAAAPPPPCAKLEKPASVAQAAWDKMSDADKKAAVDKAMADAKKTAAPAAAAAPAKPAKKGGC